MKTYQFIFVLFVSLILQIAVLPNLTILDAHYEIFFAVTIFMSIKHGWYSGTLSGIWCGLLSDICSTGPFGFLVFLYGLSGFFAASFRKIIFTQHIATKLLILFIMSIAASLVSIFFFKGFDWIVEIWSVYKLNILSIAAVNTLFSIPVYLFLDKLSYELQE